MSASADYFSALNTLLRNIGSGMPRLVVDLDRLDRNVDRLLELHAPEDLRLVAKSLPSPDLLNYLFRRLGYERLMVFHLPFLLQIVERFPAADILMGKPLPVAAMRRFYRGRPVNAFDDTYQLQWLVDTEERLLQVVDLSRDVGRRITVSIELDIGMHRGGLQSTDELGVMLDTVRGYHDELRLGGFMGYDAHVPKAPWPRTVKGALRHAKKRYAKFLEFAFEGWSDLEEGDWCVNGAGSPTIAMHHEESPLNDYSIGSALVKPAGFDLPSLANFEAAAWIATPVLKRRRGVRVPFVEKLPSRGRDTLFIYGGKWMARPCYPEGVQENAAYGVSSNQQMLTVPRDSEVAVDDYVFLRPTQSEAVFLQFGDLCMTRGDRHVGNWPVFRNRGFPAGPPA
jgi:D-serine deaminase-like pyridoxal phosphate-dependent protein